MSSVLPRLAGLALVGLLGASCAEVLDAPDDTCAPGRSVGASDSHLCLFEGAATIETGFVCPDALPYAYELDGGVLCSDSPEPPDVVIDVPMRPDPPGQSGSAAPPVPSRGGEGGATAPAGPSAREDEHEAEDEEEDEAEEQEDEAEEHEAEEPEEVEEPEEPEEG